MSQFYTCSRKRSFILNREGEKAEFFIYKYVNNCINNYGTNREKFVFPFFVRFVNFENMYIKKKGKFFSNK